MRELFYQESRFFLYLLCIVFLPCYSAFANNHKDVHPQDHPEPGVIDTQQAEGSSLSPGINERTGGYIPLNLTFQDENNKTIQLSSIIDRPTLLLPVYYNCASSCPLQLTNLAIALNGVIPIPDDDFKVIAFSFDHHDTSLYAKQAKKNYIQILEKKFPDSAWSFLVSDQENIIKLTESIGFNFKKVAPHQFIHPNAMVCLSEDGKIIRYIYGPDFLPLDISMAISEAEKGLAAISIKKLVTYCFNYDPENKKYVFSTFRVLGLSSIIILASFYFLVLRKGNKSKE